MSTNRSGISSLHKIPPLQDEFTSSAAFDDRLGTEQRISEVHGRWDEKTGKPNQKDRQILLAEKKERKSERQKLIAQGLTSELQRHELAVWLMLAFAFLAIFSWTVTWVVSYRPIGPRSYYYYPEIYVSKEQRKSSDRRRVAANIASAIVALISIPVTSSVCANAAAVYYQRKSDGKRPPLTLHQTMALADEGWSDLAILRNFVRPKPSR